MIQWREPKPISSAITQGEKIIIHCGPMCSIDFYKLGFCQSEGVLHTKREGTDHSVPSFELTP